MNAYFSSVLVSSLVVLLVFGCGSDGDTSTLDGAAGATNAGSGGVGGTGGDGSGGIDNFGGYGGGTSGGAGSAGSGGASGSGGGGDAGSGGASGSGGGGDAGSGGASGSGGGGDAGSGGASGSGGGGDAGSGGMAGSGGSGGPATWAVNVVLQGGPKAVRDFVANGASSDVLTPITKKFYATHGDDYDFLYLLSEFQNGAGRFIAAHRPAMPANGIDHASSTSKYGSPSRLKGVVGLRIGKSGNGPTLHETGHYWMNFLDKSLGFGQDIDIDWGPHWGATGVHGQLGGFDSSTIRCVSPDGAKPPCQPTGTGGRIGYTVGSFGPTANGGDTITYGELELFLMGLIPGSQVSPVTQFVRPKYIETRPDGRMEFEADGLRKVTVADIAAVHGAKTQLPASERSFKGAFILVTDKPATQAQMKVVIRWSRVFAGVETSGKLLSFEKATGGRATMDTKIQP